MGYEIIYVCNSTNNKNVREGELEILRKHEDQLYFEFGENQMNIKKRFYNDVETLNKDFNALLKLKESKEKVVEEIKPETHEEEKIEEKIEEKSEKKDEQYPKSSNDKKRYSKKNINLF